MPEPSRKLRVAISAYECNPNLGSEAGVGWQTVISAASIAERVVLITRPVEAESFSSVLPRNVDVVTTDFPGLAHVELRGGPLVRLHYLLWQVLVARLAARRGWLDGVDIAHHATYATDWQPTGLIKAAKRLGVPSFIGPISGGPTASARALAFYSMRGRTGWVVRRIYKPIARRFLAGPSIKLADHVVALNGETAELLGRLRGESVGTMPNLVFPPHMRRASDQVGPARADGVKQLLLAGRLHSWKGPYLALAAVQRLGAEYRLTIIGSGPEAAGLQRAIDEQALTNRVSLLPQVPRPDFIRMLESADCLFQPSFEDSCPGVVGEAISLGTPVVALSRGGAPELRDASPGAAVFLVSETTVDLPGELAAAIVSAAAVTDRISSVAFESGAFVRRLQEVYDDTLRAAAKIS